MNNSLPSHVLQIEIPASVPAFSFPGLRGYSFAAASVGCPWRLKKNESSD
jgi:hypothetical protein